MGFLIFITVLFGSMGYAVYKLLDLFFPRLFGVLVQYLPLGGWVLVIGALVFLVLGEGLKEPE